MLMTKKKYPSSCDSRFTESLENLVSIIPHMTFDGHPEESLGQRKATIKACKPLRVKHTLSATTRALKQQQRPRIVEGTEESRCESLGMVHASGTNPDPRARGTLMKVHRVGYRLKHTFIQDP